MKEDKLPCIVTEIALEEDEQEEKGLLFTREKKFKMRVSREGFEATLEGFYLNEPLNSLIIGRYQNKKV